MTTNVLVLCTHNSARSILAEAMLNVWAARRGSAIRAFSAGSAPRRRIHPQALAVLGQAGVDTAALRSKSWDEFVAPGAPAMRVVITVCDAAAAEQCPLWPGSPVKVHWSYPDPSLGAEVDQPRAFELTRQAIGYRMLQLAELPVDRMADAELKRALEDIAAR